ncbi:MAG TPA: polyketide synthase dehydratase domain-containing protein, partial [Pseudonocardiaceae bacterium]|nr:polyketide synthase dehydratase domain-containing protein [Pseudonocardiaceae bacterium]
PSLAAHFIQRGVPLIPLEAGARAFVAEVESADDAVEILVVAGQIATHPRTAAEITVNSRTHDYLADHAPAGTPVLPLAMALEWFAAASGGTRLCDVRVLSRIDLPDLAAGHRFTIEGQLDLRLHSSAGVHYRARLAEPGNAPATALNAPQGAAVDNVYDSPALFHGPRFQTLQRLDALSDSGADARIVGVRRMDWPEGPWWTDPAAIDGALQAAVLWARHATGDATLPMGLDELRIHRTSPAPGPLRCLVQAGPVHDGQTTCDIVLLDEDGQPRVELLGVNLISRPDLAP